MTAMDIGRQAAHMDLVAAADQKSSPHKWLVPAPAVDYKRLAVSVEGCSLLVAPPAYHTPDMRSPLAEFAIHTLDIA